MSPIAVNGSSLKISPTAPDTRTDLIRSFGIQAYCCHPLIVEDRLIGTLSFGSRTHSHFSDR